MAFEASDVRGKEDKGSRHIGLATQLANIMRRQERNVMIRGFAVAVRQPIFAWAPIPGP
jgi:hypothetical protein